MRALEEKGSPLYSLVFLSMEASLMPALHPELETHPLFKEERDLLNKGYTSIAGVDEVGRGPLAGPVVACACILPIDFHFEGVYDSKQITEKERKRLYHLLIEHPQVLYGVGVVDASQIDEINILQASLLAMRQAIHALPRTPDFLLVDGIHLPLKTISAKTVISGDSLSLSIAAASIIAKVIRDEMMVKWSEIYPEYGFLNHKGYGTKKHLEALENYGVTPLHRLSFAPCLKAKNLFTSKNAE